MSIHQQAISTSPPIGHTQGRNSANGITLSEWSNQELRDELIRQGDTSAGPVVKSTRSFYEAKMLKVMTATMENSGNEQQNNGIDNRRRSPMSYANSEIAENGSNGGVATPLSRGMSPIADYVPTGGKGKVPQRRASAEPETPRLRRGADGGMRGRAHDSVSPPPLAENHHHNDTSELLETIAEENGGSPIHNGRAGQLSDDFEMVDMTNGSVPTNGEEEEDGESEESMRLLSPREVAEFRARFSSHRRAIGAKKHSFSSASIFGSSPPGLNSTSYLFNHLQNGGDGNGLLKKPPVAVTASLCVMATIGMAAAAMKYFDYGSYEDYYPSSLGSYLPWNN